MEAQNITPQPEQEMEMLTLNLEGNSEKKPVKKWPIICAIIIAVLAVATIVIFFVIKGLNKTPEDQVVTIVDVERQAADYDCFDLFANEGPVGQSAQISLDINEFALKMIQNQYPELEMLGELNGLSIDTTFETNNGMARFALGLELEEKSIPPVEVIVDSETKSLYVASDLFSGNYLRLDMASVENEEIDTEMLQVLWDAIVNSDMTDRYFNNFLELMTAQETKKEMVTVNGVTQECTVYSAQIDFNAIAQLIVDYFKELKENNGNNSDLFDSAIENIEESLISAEEPWVLCWRVYTDDAGKIIGRDICDEDEKLLYYLVTIDGEDVGVVFTANTLEITGNAELEDGLLDGTFIVSWDDVDYLKVSTDGFDIEGFKNGTPNGSVEIEPTDDFMGLLFDEKISLPVSVTIDFESTESQQNIALSLMEMVTLNIKLSQYTPETISLPEGNEISGEDSDVLSRLLGIGG